MHSVYRSIALLVCCTLWYWGFPVNAFGQHGHEKPQPMMQHLTVENGLAGNEIYTMVQDSLGYIWFGTNNGLCRFNGNKFVKYAYRRGKSSAYSNLKLDHQGRVWCNNFGGQIFYIERDTLRLFSPWELKGKGALAQFDFLQDGSLAVTSLQHSLCIYNFKAKIWHDEGVYQNGTLGAKTTPDGVFWYWSSGKGLTKYSKGKSQLMNVDGYPIRLNQNGFLSQNANRSAFFFDHNGYIAQWQNGKYIKLKLNPTSKGLNPYILNMNTDKDGCYWVMTTDGIYCYESNGNYIYKLLEGKAIYSMLHDKEGNIWLSTMGDGLYMIPDKRIRHIEDYISSRDYESVNHITTDDKSTIYLSLVNGRIDIIHLDGDRQIETIYAPVKKEVEAMYVDKERDILFVCITQVFAYDLKSKKWLPHFSARSTSVKDFSKVTSGEIYMAGSMGVKLEANLGSNTMYKNLSNERAACVWGISLSACVYGLLSGTYLNMNGKITELKNPVTKEALYSKKIYSYKDGQCIMVTEEDGVFRYSPAEKIAEPVANNLVGKHIYSSLVQGDSLITATDEGIQLTNITSGKVSDIYKYNGLISREVREIQKVGNQLFLATASGLVVLELAGSFMNYVAPPVFINSFLVNGKAQAYASTALLSSSSRDIEFSFSSIGYKNLGKHHYQYRLMGIDSVWNKSDELVPFAHYRSLPAGHYTFEVRAINESGIASVKPATIEFYIPLPFWKQWWFALLVLCAFLFLVFILYRRRLIYIRVRSDYEKNLMESEMKALKSQMNPHFIFNALNSIKEYILLNKKEDAGKYLTKFANLMRLYLEMSEQKEVALEEEIQALHLYLQLESARFKERFNYHITVDPNLNPSVISLPPMLLQPYVENSIKHGLLHQAGERILEIKFQQRDGDTLACTISDNGVGRAATAHMKQSGHKSFATNANQKRVDLLNINRVHKIMVTYIDLESPTGTIVEVLIPI
jgi:ligand-binding sensor domain-containing protein